MDLKFDVHNLFESNEMEEFNHLANMPGSKFKFPYKNVTQAPLYTFKQEHLELFDRVRQKFVRKVDKYIMKNHYKKIISLKVNFLLGSQHKNIINKWISYAISKGANHIELIFSHKAYGMPNLDDPYIFPHTLFSTIKHLSLTNCVILPHLEFSGFRVLKTLVLKELVVEKDLLLCLFSKCLNLEDLSFINCIFKFQVNIISPTLLHLKLITCEIPKRVDIVTLNLLSFEYCGSILYISSFNAPQLVRFCLTPYCSLEELEELEIPHLFAILASLHQLQSLSVYFSPSQIARLPRTISPFQHLIEMELFCFGPHNENDDYLWVLNMVMACPRLQKLCFGIASPNLLPNQRETKEHLEFSHSELKHVELHGCVGQMIEVELAIQFLKNVNSLEHITIGPHPRIYLGDGEWKNCFGCPYWFSTGRNLIRRELQNYVKGKTQIIFS